MVVLFLLCFYKGEPITHSYLCQVSDSPLMAPPTDSDLFPLPCRHVEGPTEHQAQQNKQDKTEE